MFAPLSIDYNMIWILASGENPDSDLIVVLCYTYHVGDPLESKCNSLKCGQLFSTNCPLTSDVNISPRCCVGFDLLVLTERATSSPCSHTIDFNMILMSDDK